MQVLKRKAEEYLGEAVDAAVMTVPSEYTNDQRLATMDAAALSGISRVSLLQAWSPWIRTSPFLCSCFHRTAFVLLSALAKRYSICFQEPVAAAISHGLGKPEQEEPAILVVDIGGGTCDVSLLQSFEGLLEVIGYDGDSRLGGVDLDEAILRSWLENKLPETISAPST